MERLGHIEGAVGGLHQSQSLLMGALAIVAAMFIGAFVFLFQEVSGTRTALQAQINEVARGIADMRVDLERVKAHVELIPAIREKLEQQSDIRSPALFPTLVYLGSFTAKELTAAASKFKPLENDLKGTASIGFQSLEAVAWAKKKIPLTVQVLLKESQTQKGVELSAPVHYFNYLADAASSAIAEQSGSVTVKTDSPLLMKALKSQ